MTFRLPDESDLRALRALSREAADLPVPALNWDRVEKGLFASLEKPAALSPEARPRASTPRLGRASPFAIALAAAAAVAIVGAGQHAGSPAARAPRDSRALAMGAAETREDAPGELRVGDVIESGDREVKVQRRGIASVALAPQSRMEVLAVASAVDGSPSMTVALVRGALHAEVVPHAKGEVFAVEVLRTRVAVHGTAFTVSREGERVAVAVSHGSVVVGPTGHPGSTEGWLLVGPEHGSFSLDGATDARWDTGPSAWPSSIDPGTSSTAQASPLPQAINAQPVRAPSLVPPSLVPSVVAPSSKPMASRPPYQHDDTAVSSAEPQASERKIDAQAFVAQERAATRSILAGLEGCYERQVTSFGVRFSVESSLVLTILPTGAVREGRFNPPLSPTLMACAREAVANARFPQGESTRSISVPVRLSRP